MGIQHGGIEWRDEQIQVSEHHCHCTVDDAIGAVDEPLRLIRVTRVVGRESKW